MADDANPAITQLESLLSLFNEMDPFLDSGGWAYLSIKDPDGVSRMVLKMEDQRVRSLLMSLYLERHKHLPAWDQVYKAMVLVHGRLLKNRKGSKSIDPTMRVFLKAASDHEGWAGSAKDVLELLRSAQKAHKVTKNTHQLPISPTAMGIWLTVHQLPLLGHGIELYRPTRRSTKRLWAWRLVTKTSDTCDASMTAVTFVVSDTDSLNQSIKSESDTCDTSGTALISALHVELKDSIC